jgi:hypothetical protein
MKKKHPSKMLACKTALLFLFICLTASAQTIRYVKSGAGGNGTSWANASGDLQGIINASASNDQVWVASGTFQLGSGASYTMKEGVKIYGGFASGGNPGLSNRNWNVNTTILKGNNAPVINNSYNSLSNSAVLDGFTITGGATDNGAGIRNVYSSPTIVNCVIRNNAASNWGGGIVNIGTGTALVKNCVFYGNTASGGGAAFDYDGANTTYTNVTFSGNSSSVNGGALHPYQNSNVTLNNCLLFGNSASSGIEIYTAGNATATLKYCLVNAGGISGSVNQQNTVGGDPGFNNTAGFDYSLKATSPARDAGNTALFANASNEFDLRTYSRVMGNSIDIGAYEYSTLTTRYVRQGGSGNGNGQSWANASTNPQAMIDASVSGNEVWVAAGTYQAGSGLSYGMKDGVKIYGGFPATGTPAMSDRNWFTNVTTLQGNGNRVINNWNTGVGSSSLLDGFTITGGGNVAAGGAMINIGSSPQLKNLVVTGNSAIQEGGAFYLTNCTSLFTNVVIKNNSCGGNGGGVFSYGAEPRFINTAIVNNSASIAGGGLYYNGGGTNIRGCTIANNSAQQGGGIYFNGGTSEIRNSIIWSNSIYKSSGNPVYYHSIVAAGGSGGWNIDVGADGGNNIVTNPMFADAANGNYTLAPCSPAVNSGDNNYISSSTDVAGNSQPFYGTIDRGAYEYQGGPVAAPTASAQSFCIGATIANLTASGTNLKWYSSATGTTANGSGVSLTTNTYYVSQTINGCEGGRTAVAVTIYNTGVPTANNTQYFCEAGKVSDLSASGSNLKWYNSSTGGSVLATTTALTNGQYFVSQTQNGCESARIGVYVTIITTSAPTASAQTFCGGAVVSNLTASGTYLKWYTSAAGGSALSTSALLATGTYYVSQSPNTCESTRTAVSVTVNTTAAPTAASPQVFCMLNAPTVANLMASGTNLKWYLSSTGSDALSSNTALNPNNSTTNYTFYVSQTINGCESERIPVNTTIYYTYPPNVTQQSQSFCGLTTVANLAASITLPNAAIKWYSVASGGTALTATTAVTTNTYYAVQELSGCESTRVAVSVTVNSIALPTASAQTFCGNTTVASLAATGTALKWYAAATGGSALAGTTSVTTGTYYVSQTIGSCESVRTAVSVVINAATASPQASPQAFSSAAGATVANLVATGQNVLWFSAASGGTPLPASTLLANGTYYASQILNGCESPRTAVPVSIIANGIIYVKKSSTGGGGSWGSAFGELASAIKYAKDLNSANAGTITQIWVAAGTYKPLYRADDMSGPGNAKENAFVLLPNVKIYGGFAGTETTVSQRAISTNETILSGDFNGDDTYDGSGFLSGNISENAWHVVIAVGEAGTAELNGFTIRNGYSQSNGNLTINDIFVGASGGGVSIVQSAPALSNLVVKCNKAFGTAGGMYFTLTNPIVVTNVLVCKNYAVQYAGGICNYNSKISYINVTVAGNKSDSYYGGVWDSQQTPAAGYITDVKNCIIYGNTAPVDANYKKSYTTYWQNSLIEGTGSWNNANGTNSGGNVVGNPLFVDAAAGNYTLQANSPSINTGSLNHYPNAAADVDAAGKPRVANLLIDMGALEYVSTTDCSIATTWNGSAWSNGTPTSYNYAATIAGNYSSTANLVACSLNVTSGTVSVNAGNNFIIKGAVTVTGGSLTIQNNAALVQEGNVANSGNIIVKRNSNALYRQDYTFWGSPVAGQQLQAFSPATLSNRFYTYGYNFSGGTYKEAYLPETATNNFTLGKGYLIRMPNIVSGLAGYDDGATSYVFNGSFNGVPNNGPVTVATTLTDLQTGGTISQAGHYTAVANPYPSPISVAAFFAQNVGVIEPGNGIYFWRKKNNGLSTSYANLTLLGYVANSATGGDIAGGGAQYFTGGTTGSFNAGWILSPAQGFLVKFAANPTGPVTFTNSMRRTTAGSQAFFRTGNVTEATEEAPAVSRLWLNLSNTNNEAFSQMAVGYLDGATLGLDYGYDARNLGEGNAKLYSIENQDTFAIQARPAFEQTDVVPVGFAVTAPGQYSINIDHNDGVFSNGQQIYLIDKLMGITTNLSEGTYSFTTESGTFDTRFDVVYMPDSELGVENPEFANKVVIYQQGKELKVASSLTIEKVAVYDMLGREIYTISGVNNTEFSKALHVAQGVAIVKVTLQNGVVVSKKVILE